MVTPTAERRRREREAREGAILASARQLFLEKGVAGTTIDEIARSCSLAKGTIYLYFASKDDIAFALLLEGTRELVTALRASLDPAASPVQQLEGLALAYYRFFVSQPESFRYMFVVPHESYTGRVAEGLLAEWGYAGREALGLVADVLEEAAVQGELEVSDPWTTAVAMWSAITGVIAIPSQEVRRAFLGEVDVELLLRELLAVLLRGMSKGRAQEQGGPNAG